MARRRWATSSRSTTRSWRFPPTRWTSSCPLPRAARSREILAEEGDTVGVGQVIARLAPGDGAVDGAASHSAERRAHPRTAVRRRRRPPMARRAARSPPRRSPTALASPRSPRAWRPPRASTWPACPGADPAGGSSRPTCSAPGQAAMVRAPPWTAARAAEPKAERTAAEGRRGDARALHGRVALDPDSHQLQDPHRDRARGTPARARRTPAKRVSFTHLIAYAIAQAAGEMGVMTHHFDEHGRQALPRQTTVR